MSTPRPAFHSDHPASSAPSIPAMDDSDAFAGDSDNTLCLSSSSNEFIAASLDDDNHDPWAHRSRMDRDHAVLELPLAVELGEESPRGAAQRIHHLARRLIDE